jgi:hypothetical protein
MYIVSVIMSFGIVMFEIVREHIADIDCGLLACTIYEGARIFRFIMLVPNLV